MRHSDVEVCAAIGSLMHQESYYRDLDFDRKKMRLVFEQIKAGGFCGFVAEEKGKVIGLFVGLVCEHWFGKDLLASDLALYVIPKRRGSTAAMRLVRAYEKWAEDKGAKVISLGVSTDIRPERTGSMYERLGFNDVGKFYRRRS